MGPRNRVPVGERDLRGRAAELACAETHVASGEVKEKSEAQHRGHGGAQRATEKFKSRCSYRKRESCGERRRLALNLWVSPVFSVPSVLKAFDFVGGHRRPYRPALASRTTPASPRSRAIYWS